MPALPIDIIVAAVESDESLGFCLECGTEHAGIEPDARRYHCNLNLALKDEAF
jgi:hypothetical protein